MIIIDSKAWSLWLYSLSTADLCLLCFEALICWQCGYFCDQFIGTM